MYTWRTPLFPARVARLTPRVTGAVHAADLAPDGGAVTLCGVQLPPARAVILPATTEVSCWRCEKGMTSPAACIVRPFPGVNLDEIAARRARMADLWRHARRAYSRVRRLRDKRKKA